MLCGETVLGTRCFAQLKVEEGHGMKTMRAGIVENLGISGLETVSALCDTPFGIRGGRIVGGMSDEGEVLLRVYRRRYVEYAREKKAVRDVGVVQSLC